MTAASRINCFGWKPCKVDGMTPGFFVNGTPLRDFGEAQLRALVDQEIKKVKAP